jgi:hypothetical protein
LTLPTGLFCSALSMNSTPQVVCWQGCLSYLQLGHLCTGWHTPSTVCSPCFWVRKLNPLPQSHLKLPSRYLKEFYYLKQQ